MRRRSSRAATTTLRIAGLLATVVAPAPLLAQSESGTSPDLERIQEEAERLWPLNSLIVQYRGELLVEEYFRGMRADRPVNVKSVSKTLLSPLIGIAIREGLIEGVDQPLADLLPDEFARIDDPVKRSVTLHHLLSMTTGIEGTSFGNYGEWIASPDWVEYALDRPVVCDPGSCMTYSTGNTHLASVILARRSGMSTREYFERHLFGPLGIPVREWDRDPDEVHLGGNNMSLTPREMLRFGELFLKGGEWEGRQLVPAEWIGRSWGQYTRSPWNGHRYGYYWWTREFGGETVRFAWGYGGQFIFLVPRMDLVVVVTSSLVNRPRGVDHNDRVYDFLGGVVIPELRVTEPAGRRR